MTAAGYQMKRVKVDSTLHLPSFCGMPTLRGSTATEGAIAIDTCNDILYKWTNQAGWTSVTGGGGSQNLQSVLDVGNSSYNKDINLYGRSSGNQIYLSGMDNYWMPFMALGDSIGGAVYTYTYPQATIEFQNKYQSQKLKQQDSIRAIIYLPTQTIDATDTLATLSDVRSSSQNGRFGNDTATVVMVKVHNDAGVTLTNGKVVSLTSSGNNNESPAVRLANNKHDSTSANTLGFVTGTIANQDTGWVILSGKIEKLNTSSFSNGDIIYLDSVSGNITKTKPAAPYHLVYLGVVVKANAGNGAIFVKAQNGYEVEELHNAKIVTPLNNQVFAYSDTQSLWKNRNIYSIVDTTSLSSRINTKLAIADTSVFLRKTDSTTYYTKYRSDTSRTNIYSAIEGKQATLTNPVTGTGTNNQIAYFNSTGSTIASLPVATYPSLTELSYVKGTTSAVQTQIDNKFTTPTGWTDYFASSTINGGTGAGGVINYILMGKILFVQLSIAVTSNATSFNFTLPYTNGTTPQFGFGRGINNGNTQISVGMYIAASTNVVTLLMNSANITTPNLWTAANGKSVQGFLMLNIP
jgi:hypothetical protein